jgi:hypothetical protein
MFRVNNQLWAQLGALGLANVPANNDAAILAWSGGGTINQNVISHLSSYLILHPQVPGPYEIHPYIFREIAHFDFSRKYLLLGTFPPNSYLNNILPLAALAAANMNVPPAPVVDFYYGNKANLWNYFGINPVTVPNIHGFLTDNSISISDVILGTQRKVFNSATDSQLYNILPNTAFCHLLSSNSKVETVLFTSGRISGILFDNNGNVKIDNTIPPSTLRTFFKILKEQCGHELEICGDPLGAGPFYPLNAQGVLNAAADQQGNVVSYISSGGKIIRLINLPNPAVAIGHMRSPLFLKWLQYKATISGLPAPPAGNWQAYMQLFPNIFWQNYPNQYRSEIYQMAIHNLATLLNL